MIVALRRASRLAIRVASRPQYGVQRTLALTHVATFSPIYSNSTNRFSTSVSPPSSSTSTTSAKPSATKSTPLEPEISNELTTARGSELVLSPPALVVTREYEWGNIILGFEQANKYTIRAAPGGEVVGYIAEQDSITRTVARNVLRTRRAFRATVLDKHGDPVFILRRPAYLVSSSLYVEHPDGTEIGEIQMRWHVYRRRYDCYVQKSQFARVDSGFLAVDFDMVDDVGNKLASVNKDFTGLAREIFTDARQYVLRLDPSLGFDAMGLVNDKSTIADTVLTEQKLSLDQRAVLLATAISIDFDYFSIHSRGTLGPGGMMMPMPIPIPGGGAGSGAAGAAGAAAGAGADAVIEDPDDDGLGPIEGEGNYDDDDDGLDLNEDEDMGDPAMGSDGYEDVHTDHFNAPDDDANRWGTFEQPDYGFQEEPVNEEWSDIAGDGEEGAGTSIFGILSDIFGGGE